jgi:hypothetical protein
MNKKLKHARKSERFITEAPIGFMVALSPRLIKSKILNCSQEGIFFESELELLPGTVVLISSDGDSKYYRAKVKWTEKSDRVDVDRYGIGAEYIDPQ